MWPAPGSRATRRKGPIPYITLVCKRERGSGRTNERTNGSRSSSSSYYYLVPNRVLPPPSLPPALSLSLSLSPSLSPSLSLSSLSPLSSPSLPLSLSVPRPLVLSLSLLPLSPPLPLSNTTSFMALLPRKSSLLITKKITFTPMPLLLLVYSYILILRE